MTQRTLSPKQNYSGTLGIDSLDVMELLMNLEEAFGTEIEMGENKINTVSDLVTLIESKLD